MKLYIIRGLPGSGKSTYAKKIGCFHVEADMFHVCNGKYQFDPKNVKAAHEWCQFMVRIAMTKGIDVVVSNTSTKKWEVEEYLKFAKEFNYDVEIIALVSKNYGNIHNVPEDVLSNMKDRWESIDGETLI